MQNTLAHNISFTGVGLHSGTPARIEVQPAPANFGVQFQRIDLGVDAGMIPARWDHVEQTALCTRLVGPSGQTVSTIEHIMAALAGCGVHNAKILIDGPEVPIMDGSAAPFVGEILRTGLRTQQVALKVIRVLAPVRVETQSGWAALAPSATPEMTFHIDFADAAIGQQNRAMSLSNGAFVRELCDARTFCRSADVDAMRAQGLALGGSLENAVVVDGDQILSPGGLRHRDEAVRHKMLDALGDLALAGAPILGRYDGFKSGHSMTNELLRRLFATPGAWAIETATPAVAARLPGVGASLAEFPQVA